MSAWLLLAGAALAATIEASPRVVASETGGQVVLVDQALPPGTRVAMVRHVDGQAVEHVEVVGADGGFAVPAWQVPGRYEVRVEGPDGAPRCVAGGIEIVAQPCEVAPAAVEREQAALTAAGEQVLVEGGRCLAAQGVTDLVAFGLAGPGEGLGLLREERSSGRTLALGYRPDLAVGRAEAGAGLLDALLPQVGQVHAVGLARPLPPVEAHAEDEWSAGPRVDLVGGWSTGLGPAGCPVTRGVPDDDTVACLVEADLRAVVVAAPDRVRRLDEGDERDPDDPELIEAVARLRAARLPVVLGARPDDADGVLIVPVGSGRLPPPQHFPVEGCSGSSPWSRPYAYGRGEEPGWHWAVAAGSGLATSAGHEGVLGPVAGGMARVGIAHGPFIGAELAAALVAPHGLSVGPVVGVELGAAPGRVPVALFAAGRGLATPTPAVGLGGDLPLFAGFARRLVLALGPRAVVGLVPDSGWSLGFDARLGWREQRSWGHDAR